MLTYGDGVGNINIRELLEFHKKHNKFVTITAVQPSGRFGALNLDKQDKVLAFQEKPKGDNAWINGGFFVLEPQIFNYIEGDETWWEREPMERLAKEGQMSAFLYRGFWHPMDTLRDKNYLEQLWQSGQAPWKIWE
jgi:glucose-1-phosphate cytidylyltransferase